MPEPSFLSQVSMTGAEVSIASALLSIAGDRVPENDRVARAGGCNEVSVASA